MNNETKRCVEALNHSMQSGTYLVGDMGVFVNCSEIIDLIESLSKHLEQVTRERDAAIDDVKELCMKHSYSMCHYCKYYSDDECEHSDCRMYNSMENWQWKGANVEGDENG